MKLETPIIRPRMGRVSIIMNGFTKGRAKRYIKRHAKRLGLPVSHLNGMPEIESEHFEMYYVNSYAGRVRLMYWED